jgi:hypothetical protein
MAALSCHQVVTAQRFLGNLDGGRLVGLIDFEHVVPIPVAADAESAPRA